MATDIPIVALQLMHEGWNLTIYKQVGMYQATFRRNDKEFIGTGPSIHHAIDLAAARVNATLP